MTFCAKSLTDITVKYSCGEFKRTFSVGFHPKKNVKSDTNKIDESKTTATTSDIRLQEIKNV